MSDGLVGELRAHGPALIAIGASAGAVEVLLEILPRLPAQVAAAVVVVVHVPPDRPSALPALFARRCALPVREAEDKLPASSGSIYFAPAGYHLLVERGGTLALSADDPVNYSRPSIDVLLESAAYAYGPRALGILLSGASEDGAAGLALMRERGSLTWVQAPDTAPVAVMPLAALSRAPHVALAPGAMAEAIARWVDP